MKKSLKDVYKNLLSENTTFGLDHDTPLMISPDNNTNIQILPSKDDIEKNSQLKNKAFIYKLNQEDIEKIGRQGSIQIDFVDVVSFGKLDSINTSIDDKYRILKSNLDNKQNNNYLKMFGKTFFNSFKSVYLSKALDTKSNSIDFSDDSVKSNIKNIYKKNIKEKIIDNKKKFTLSKDKEHVLTNSLSDRASLSNSIDFLKGKKIIFDENLEEDYFFTGEKTSLFDYCYQEFLKSNEEDSLMKYSVDDTDSEDINKDNSKKLEIAKLVLGSYTNENFIQIYKDLKNTDIRTQASNIEEVVEKLNNSNLAKKSLKFINRDRIGPGEFICHLMFDTKNCTLPIEPDVVFNFPDGKTSVKSFRSGAAQTGTNMKPELKKALQDFFKLIYKEGIKNVGAWSSTSGTWKDIKSIYTVGEVNSVEQYNTIREEYSNFNDEFFNMVIGKELVDNNIKKINSNEKLKSSLKEAWKQVKIETIFEHGAESILCSNEKQGTNPFYYITKEDVQKDKSNNQLDRIKILSCRNNRVSFKIDQEPSRPNDNTVEGITKTISENKVYRKNKMLKEVYSHLYPNKKFINEGGVGGHMLHPYEVLEGTPRDLINRIKQYGVSQKLIEKVDGQNLFFTVEKDGTPLFARNKQDMTHQDLIEKFTAHRAEKPFLEGGNAIVQGVQQWKNSGPQFFEQEVIETFHPVEGQKSFINFEIMHPDKPNQIKYDKRYIVFHGIVDFEYGEKGREEVYRTNKGERLQRIIRQMRPGVQSAGFVLASNRTVDMNALTNVQIAGYVEQIKQIAASIGITEDQDFATGVLNSIKQKLAAAEIETNRETLKKIEDFVLYGEDIEGNSIQGKDVKKLFSKEDAKKLTALGLTSATKASRIISDTLTQFAPIFVNLGIDLLSGVKSAYMSDDFNRKNIDELREKLQLAIDDYDTYVAATPEDEQSNVAKRLKRHIDVVKDTGLENIVNSAVEGGVYDENGDLLKVTGGFAPMNQIIGAAYRDNEGIFPTFIKRYGDVEKNESKKYSLKSVFNLID